MKPQVLKKIIIGLVIFWVVAGMVLAGLTFSGVISKDHFETMFVIGFVGFAILAGLLGRVLNEIQGPGDSNS